MLQKKVPLLMAGMQTIPSGVAAVINATIPVWILLLLWFGDRRQRLSRGSLLGIGAGLAGVALLSAPWDIDPGDALDPGGAVAVLGAAVAWAAGTVRARNSALVPASLQSVSMQLLAGGLGCLVVAAVLGEPGRVTAASWTGQTVAAMAYLAICGSLLAVVAYMWLLGHVDAGKVSTYAFVNPVVAVLLGWALAGEPLTPRILAASAITLAGVVLIVMPRRSESPT